MAHIYYKMKISLKLDKRGKAVIRLALWSGLMVWLIMYLALAVIMSRAFAGVILTYGNGPWKHVFYYLGPGCVIFTALLTVIIIARWANRRLRR
jgi:ABC-type multidrug transport system permease subunit